MFGRLRSVLSIMLLSLISAAPLHAALETQTLRCEPQICVYVWPRLPAVQGWHHEHDSSYLYGANAQAPDGQTFATADAVIYARAVYRAGVPGLATLQQLIDNDRRQFIEQDADVIIRELKPLINADGQRLRSFSYFPQLQHGSYEQLSYGEEGEYFIVVTLSARSRQGYHQALPAYRRFIKAYR
ncbi:MAG: hypothetical protein HY940_09695 [Gammaproteobacteria bacterium]|nr:hypothetical protein [Gammaproteobacteria bacterium]